MATITPTIEQIPGGGIMRITWVMANGDTGVDANYPGWADRNVQVFGTFSSAVVNLQGSNNGANWVSLSDMSGTSLAAIGSASIKMIQENTLHVRPVTSGGDGLTALTVVVIARRM